MKWFILLVGIVVLCLVVALLLGLAGGGLGRASSSLSHEPLPDEPLTDTDFDDLVFDVGARGYRMSQVDGVVDRLRRELREKDEEIAVLRGEAQRGHDDAAAAAVSPADPGPDPVSGPVSDPDGGDPDGGAGRDAGTGHETSGVDEDAAPATSATTGGHERTP